MPQLPITSQPQQQQPQRGGGRGEEGVDDRRVRTSESEVNENMLSTVKEKRMNNSVCVGRARSC